MTRDLSTCCHQVWTGVDGGHGSVRCGAPSAKFFLVEVDGQRTVQPLCGEHSVKDPAPWGAEVTRDEALVFLIHLA